MVPVYEIFNSIEGEGIRSGALCTFVRLYGCNLDCVYCDTRYSCEDGTYKDMTTKEILAEVSKYSTKLITITGGEPLMHPGTTELISWLVAGGYEVNIETNGSIDVEPFIKRGVIVTMDYKSIYSGMSKKMLMSNLALLTPTDVLKFVVSDLTDMEDMLLVLTQNQVNAVVYISPVYGKIEMSDIVDYMKANIQLVDCRLQIQLHKVIWPVEMRGV